MTKMTLFLIAAVACTQVNAQSWSLTGNAGTTPGTNFVGTTDSKQLVFKVNSTEVVRFKAGGKIDINNSRQSMYIGKNAGLNDASSGNVFIGFEAARFNDVGPENVALGYRAMYNCSGYGDHNVAVGYQALYSGVNGQSVFNTAIGADAMHNNTYGVNNTTTGYYSMYYNTSGSFNTANGYFALGSNLTGGSNTASGTEALGYNTSGNSNTASGSRTLYANTTGNVNSAVGSGALKSNQTGSYNVAVGGSALASAVNNSSNVAIGDSALALYNDGTLNDYMLALGSKALLSNLSGYFNTAVGGRSLLNNTYGSYNTALGTFALNTVTTGSQNTALGYGANVNAANRFNATALGFGAVATADNQVMLGNSSVTSVRAAGSYVIYSDGRFKKDIRENVPGLAFINLLKPVTYHYDIHGLNKQTGAREDDNRDGGARAKAAIDQKEKILYTGLVAQEVEKAAQTLNYDFSGLYKPQNDKDVYGLSYADFVVPLVKAVQELSRKNDEKEAVISQLQQQNETLEARLTAIESMLRTSNVRESAISTTVAAAGLEQNVPNPFSNATIIPYTLPAVYSKATLVVSDQTGKALQQISLSGHGKGTAHVNASLLTAGSYQYSLYVDGKLVDTKQMLSSR